MSRTIFCLGGRSHYENATSDLLAFFLDPQEEHGLKTLFIDALIEVADLSGAYGEELTVMRERRTENNKRLDLLIQDSLSLLVIENKHWATDNNPFADYEAYVRGLAAGPLARACEFVLLGFQGEARDRAIPPLWKQVRYDAWLDAIERRLRRSVLDDRWRILTYEFITHLRIESQFYSPELVDGMLRAIRAGGGPRRRRYVDTELAKIALHVLPRLRERLGMQEVRQGVWSTDDADQGWPGGDALDFQVREHKSSDATVSLAVRYSYDAPIEPTQQLLLVAWIRAGAAPRAALAEARRTALSEMDFRQIQGPSADRYWATGTAHVLDLLDTTLDVATDALARVYGHMVSAQTTD